MNRYLLLILFLITSYGLFGQSIFEEGLRLKFDDAHFAFGHTAPKLGNAEIVKIKMDGAVATVYLEMPQRDILSLDDHDFEDFVRPLQNYGEENGMEEVRILIKSDEEKAEYEDILTILDQNESPAPIYVKPRNNDPFPEVEGDLKSLKANRFGSAPHYGQAQPTGALSGKTVWLSPGHGFIYYTSLNNYSTQRGNTNDMVEDFGTIEIVGYYLLKYLWNAGANVFMVRERDFNANEVVVDNDDGTPTYTETGSWTTSTSTGYNGGTYRYAYSNTSSETATATYTPNIPEEGWYWVSVYFKESSNRSVDTRYTVNHAGGSTTVSVNQEVHGETWYYIGQFYFDAGTGGSVTLSNLTSDGTATQAIISDAVRFGGGMGSEEDCDVSGVGTSGHHRFEEGAQLYAPFMGYPTCNGDVSIRPKYAEWELSKGTAEEQNDPTTNTWNSVYVSWHTNACCGGQGTSSFIYEPGTSGTGDSGNPTNCDGSAGGDASGYLRNYIHDQVLDDIHTGWDPSWLNRGYKCAYFGEVGNLTTMPGALFEMGFHDNPSDAEAITTPYFRELEARAVYKGLVKFFNHYDSNVSTTMIPEPPTHLAAKNSALGEITLTWDAPTTGGILGDAASGYQVYVSTHGKGFADGIAVSGTSYTVTGLDPGTTYYFKVAATNDGGESFPTSVVAARATMDGSSPNVLIVDGFDRLQRSQMVYQYETSALGSLYRGFLEKMNAYTYMVEHAKSLESCGAYFDGTTNDAVINGTVTLIDYALVDWFFGEESTNDRTFDATEEALMTAFLNGGGDLIVSGAEIGWDIGRSGSSNASVAFYNNYLKATYNGDDSNSYDFAGVAGSLFDGVSGAFDDGTNTFDAQYPDRLGAAGGSAIVMDYAGGTGDGAAVAFNDPNGFGVVNFGFPLETVTDAAIRNDIICKSVNYLNAEIVNDCTDGVQNFDEEGIDCGGIACEPCNCSYPDNIVVDLGVDPNKVVITWDPVPGALKYQVRYRRTLTTEWTYKTVTNPIATVNGLTQNKLYDYRIRTQCANGAWSDLSVIDKFRTVLCKAPVNFVTTQLSNNKVRIEWQHYTYADKYQIQYRQAGSSNDYTSLVTWDVGQNFRVLNNLTPGMTYEYKVRSFCEVSYGPFSNLRYFTNTSAREFQSEELSIYDIYPNPTDKDIYMTFAIGEGNKGDVRFTLTNLLGKTVREFEKTYDTGLNQQSIDVKDLEEGYYIITIKNDDQSVSERFMKVN